VRINMAVLILSFCLLVGFI